MSKVLTILAVCSTIGMVCSLSAQSKDEDLSGTWDLLLYGRDWKIELKRDKTKEQPGGYFQYCGMATPMDKATSDMEWCGGVDMEAKKVHFRVPGASAIACEAPLTSNGTFTGKCTILGQRESLFKATLVPPK